MTIPTNGHSAETFGKRMLLSEISCTSKHSGNYNKIFLIFTNTLSRKEFPWNFM